MPVARGLAEGMREDVMRGDRGTWRERDGSEDVASVEKLPDDKSLPRACGFKSSRVLEAVARPVAGGEKRG